LELNLKDPSIHNNLGWLYAAANGKNFQDKLKALEHAAKQVELSNERNAEILETLARVYFIDGKDDGAIESEKKALKLESNNERLEENLKKSEKAMKNDCGKLIPSAHSSLHWGEGNGERKQAKEERQMEKLRKTIEIGFIVALLLMPAVSVAGSLDPPASAVDASGNPVPTKMTPPSWSQKLPTAERFELVLDGAAVLDKETGLVWEKAPSTATFLWIVALSFCNNLQLGGRMGWHLPTVEQLATLVDPSVSPPGPTLPTGHPFSNVQPSYYWSATTVEVATIYAWDVNFRYGFEGLDLKEYRDYHAWCVRGGETYNAR
jgi:hypothetical protein